MKEATGELSMTAIVVVILAVLAVVAPIIIRTAGNTMKMRVACQSAYGCTPCNNEGKMTCSYVDDKGTTHDNISCSCSNANNNSDATVNSGR